MGYPDFAAIEAARAAQAQTERDNATNGTPWVQGNADGTQTELPAEEAAARYNARADELERVRDKYYELLHVAKFPGIAEWQVIGKSTTRQNGEPYMNLSAAQIAKINDLPADTMPSGIQMKFVLVQCGAGS